ncbi:MAG: hypothetical protein WBJ37_01750 [Bacteroidales bacterium]
MHYSQYSAAVGLWQFGHFSSPQTSVTVDKISSPKSRPHHIGQPLSAILIGRAQKGNLLKHSDYLMNMDDETIKKIINYGDKYLEKHLTNVFDIHLMLKDWWEGLQFFLSRSFYQGRRDTISMRVEEKAMKALKNYHYYPINNLESYFIFINI